MPDVLTHLLFGIALALVWKPETREEGMLIVLGAILIDVERPFSWFLSAQGFSWLSLTPPFHSILGSLCLAFAASSCFEMKMTDFWDRFKLIEGGCVLHLLLDSTMWVWKERGLYLLYPLKIPFSLHLVWPDFVWFPLIGVLAVVLASVWRFVIEAINCTTTSSN